MASMALDALRCNHLAPLGFKGLTLFTFVCRLDDGLFLSRSQHCTCLIFMYAFHFLSVAHAPLLLVVLCNAVAATDIGGGVSSPKWVV